jgi:hypothetical protein
MDPKNANQSQLSDCILKVVEKNSPAIAEKWAKNEEDIKNEERLDKMMTETNSEALRTQLINCGVFLGLASKTREEAIGRAEEVSEILEGSRHLEPKDRQHQLGYALVDMYERCEFAMSEVKDENSASMEKHLDDMAGTLAKVHASPSCGSGLRDKIEKLSERERGTRNRTDGRLHQAMDGLCATIVNLRKGGQLEENPDVSWAGQVKTQEREVRARNLERTLGGDFRVPSKMGKGLGSQTGLDEKPASNMHEK